MDERALQRAEAPCLQAGTRICAFRDLFKPFPLVKPQRACIVLIDIQGEAARRKPSHLVEKETSSAASLCLRRDRELIEIGRHRIETYEAKQPVRAVKSADRDGSGRFEGPQTIEI